MNNICIITPTIGRPTLRRTLESGILEGGDKWLVIADGPDTEAKKVVAQFQAKEEYLFRLRYCEVQKTGDYGNEIRDIAMSLSFEDYFIFLDDDDVLVPGAIEIIKRTIAKVHPRPIMFKMINGNGEILWCNREVTPGNVGGSMFCCPNAPGKLGKWANGAGHRSDFEFIQGTLDKYGPGWRQHLMWSDDVIIHCRPEGK